MEKLQSLSTAYLKANITQNLKGFLSVKSFEKVNLYIVFKELLNDAEEIGLKISCHLIVDDNQSVVKELLENAEEIQIIELS